MGSDRNWGRRGEFEQKVTKEIKKKTRVGLEKDQDGRERRGLEIGCWRLGREEGLTADLADSADGREEGQRPRRGARSTRGCPQIDADEADGDGGRGREGNDQVPMTNGEEKRGRFLTTDGH